MNDEMHELEPVSDWASRRKNIYLGGVVIVLSAVSFWLFWQFWYSAPTCFDKIKNGDEMGIDCGGSCSLLCSANTLKPVVRWDPRIFEVSPGLWNALIYVENPNIDAAASYLPYTFTLYGEGNTVLATRTGATVLPKNQTVGIFEGGISIADDSSPRRATFDLGGNIVWKKDESLDAELEIKHGPLLRLDSAPRVEANIKNEGVSDIQNIELVVAVFDGADNAVAASRTFVEKLSKDEDASVLFTWPRPFDLGSKVCEVPSDVALLLDRSGSMASLGSNPPEPLTEAKSAATSFIKRLTTKDKISLISFATNAKNPIDLLLTKDFATAEEVIGAISIGNDGTQYTNIYEALHSALQELLSARSDPQSSKIIVLLTDGVANNPRDPQGRTEADDVKYAEGLAIKEAALIKKEGVTIYTIGLGSSINAEFLKQVASGAERYFFAPSADQLETIYKNISSSICKELPVRIEITHKVFGASL